jgi:predicted nucleotidyltransferase
MNETIVSFLVVSNMMGPVDFRHPVEAVIPGAQGRVLAVLLNAGGELNLRTIARLADVSLAQTSRVVPRLVSLGLVERREVPPSSLFRLVPEHVAARALLELADARRQVLVAMAAAAGEIEPAPVSLIVFGSFARGDDELGSDIDVVIVRPPAADGDEDWVGQVEQWRTTVGRIAGRHVELLYVAADEAAARLASRSALWRDVRRDGRVVFGEGLSELAGRISA